MKLFVLGSSCKRCAKLMANVETVVAEDKLDAVVEKITDPMKIVDYGVMNIPALVINDKVVAAGQVLSTTKIREYISQV